MNGNLEGQRNAPDINDVEGISEVYYGYQEDVAILRKFSERIAEKQKEMGEISARIAQEYPFGGVIPPSPRLQEAKAQLMALSKESSDFSSAIAKKMEEARLAELEKK